MVWHWFTRAGDGAHVVVVGAGYIGVEVAEAALRRGLGVTVVTRGRGLALLEDEMSERVAVALCDAGAEVVLGVEVTGLDVAPDEAGVERVTGVRWEGDRRDADLVVLALGVRPGTDFLDGSGLETADNGALRPDAHGRVAEHVWAAGDCCEVRRRLDDRWVFRPLGTHATKHGRALGDSLAGERWPSRASWTPRSPGSPRAGSTSRSPAPAWVARRPRRPATTP